MEERYEIGDRGRKAPLVGHHHQNRPPVARREKSLDETARRSHQSGDPRGRLDARDLEELGARESALERARSGPLVHERDLSPTILSIIPEVE
jgi:hypothetical protein